MSILDLDLDGAQEPTVVEAFKEYKIRIMKCDPPKEDKSGFLYVLPLFEIPDEPASKSFTKYVRLATKANLAKLDNLKAKNGLKWANTELLLCLGIDPKKKFDPENDLPGKSGWAILGIEEDAEFGDKNIIRKFIVPK